MLRERRERRAGDGGNRQRRLMSVQVSGHQTACSGSPLTVPLTINAVENREIIFTSDLSSSL